LCDIEEMNLKERVKDAKHSMKTRVLRNAIVLSVLVALSVSSQAQTTTYIVDQFNPSGTGGYSYSGGQIGNVWGNWFGSAFQSLVWDSANDASNNPSSGSMKITANFNGQGSIPNQFEVYDGFNGITPALNGLQYTNFQCDVRFAKGSATVNNTFGHLEFGIAVGSGQDYFGSVDVPSSNTNWVHVSILLNATTDANLQSINDVLIHIYGPSMSGVSTFWVDNIKFVGWLPATTNCVVNWNDLRQRIDGFGASSAWMSGSLSTSAADLLFSTNNGAGLSLLRTRIAPDGTSWETSIAQQAQARGAKIWSTPWSPPAADKDSGVVNGGNFVSSVANYQGYAAQLANYVASMTNVLGTNLYAVSVQNEPDSNHPDTYVTNSGIITTNFGYESCIWSAKQIHDFVPYLSTALSNNNVASTRIMVAEDESWKWDLAATAMNDNVSNLVGVLAAHNYGSSATAVTQFGNPCPKPLWETEHYFGSDDTIVNGVALAQEIHSFMTVAGANAYHYWWLQGSGTGSLVGNSWTTPAKRIYVMGNYSRFVRPGYYRIGVSNNAFTSISAYKDTNSGSFAIVAINYSTATATQIFNLANFTASSVTPWITSGTLSLASQSAVGVTNAAFTYALPALSVVTFVGQQQPSNTPPTLAPVANQTINAGATLVVTNTATDTNQPTPTLVFSLLGAPNNATLTPLNNTNAIFTWRPLVSQANTTNPVTVKVINNGTSLSATNSFKVTINPLAQPVVSSISVSGGQVSLVATGAVGPDYTVWVSTNLTSWQVLFTSNSPPTPVTLVDTNNPGAYSARFYRVQLGP
jgi:glucuronoarabinoxylan endo-1,4-beta-xylanase